MASFLFASKEDISMLQDQLDMLKKGYGTLDYIANEIHHLRLEQDCQGAQMRRLEERMDKMEQRMDKFEQRMDRMEQMLVKICRHLSIV